MQSHPYFLAVCLQSGYGENEKIIDILLAMVIYFCDATRKKIVTSITMMIMVVIKFD